MSKMRVYEYAKKNQVTSKQVIEQLKKLNIDVANHMSSITAETIAKLDQTFRKQEQKQTEQPNRQPKQQSNKRTEQKRPDKNVGQKK